MKLKTGQKCAFGFGAFGKDIVYMLISSYLLYYYNVVLGMSSVFIGTESVAYRVLLCMGHHIYAYGYSVLVYDSRNH